MLNGEFLEGLSQHMPVDYYLLEVNESGTKLVAKVDSYGHECTLFVYDLENDRHWYIHDISCSIFGMHFLGDQNLLFCFVYKMQLKTEIKDTTNTQKYSNKRAE